ncbi:Por secretion system C-terminal sorting domain [Chryseobacterium nakagawai]|uniref:T9SS C-terminal target domain-containing protein n=1 Tax=Chryseobacterium nakagawai TaxID=1241982 RepID=A0AAD0YIK8_CHRNA|nr:T9SS type A sorting domain-containing protein [Chryseobacterium nakagawai]AZA89592.1 T9SS C-terminal target domain-containing protein [Chryseobacterium nakagawai]VEH20969.1 Por secretion system C-terminal sorting domain [Chryseobacterium nakagawai]
MKKIYSIACSLLAVFFFAQQTISFEDNEGFMIGNIHGQGMWISTPTGGNPENVIHQTISTDIATDGSSALKIVRESMYGVQTEPIIGGFYNLAAPLISSNFSVSFDINMSQFSGSVFGFQGVNNMNEQTFVRVDFDNTGIINVLNKGINPQNMVATSGLWSPNQWYRIKVVGTAMEIRYYLNDILFYTEANTNSNTMDQLRFVHNNGLGMAYFDNIKINEELALSVKEIKANVKALTVYPNPAVDIIKINTSDRIKRIEVYDLTGKKINITLNGDKIDVRELSSGTYLLNIETEGQNFTKKFIKK